MKKIFLFLAILLFVGIGCTEKEEVIVPEVKPDVVVEETTEEKGITIVIDEEKIDEIEKKALTILESLTKKVEEKIDEVKE